MFGFFKKKEIVEEEKLESPKQKVAREEFERHTNTLRGSDKKAHDSAGQGIKMANSFFYANLFRSREIH